jgi:type IV secretory pathway VirB2 component (pilin)
MEVHKMQKIHILLSILFLSLIAAPIIEAVDINTTITASEKASFDQILVPVMKIYNFVKYSASVIAVIALLYAGISYMMAGSDPKMRDISKNVAAYVIIGLVIIWAAPYIVNLLI